jgi:hypothetical protein
MGAPQLAENAPAKKRGELYGNRMQGLGRPSGPPISRAGSPAPVPTTGESLAPRKRCVSTGGALSSAPPSFTTDEPVPALPSNLSGFAPRRNSVAVDSGPGRRVVSTGNADGKAAELAESYSPSPLSASTEKSSDSSLPPPDTTESSSPTADVPQSQNTLEVSSVQAEELEPTSTEVTVNASETPELLSALEEKVSPPEDEEESPAEGDAMPIEEEVTPSKEETVPTEEEAALTEEEAMPTEEEATLTEEEAMPTGEEATPTEEEASPTVMSTSEVEAPAIEDPAPSIDGTLSVNESSQKVTQSLDIEESIIDSVPDYESAPQSAVSQSSPVLVIPESASSISSTGPSDVVFVAPQSPSAPTEKGPVPTSSTSSPPEKAVIPTVVSTCEAGGTISITVPNPEVPVPSSAPETGIRSEGKRSFKAVVHRKVTEKPAVTVPASTLVAPPTPQVVRPRRSANSNVVEVPASPGYGDLAVLLEDAALLEMRLTEGDNVGSKAGGLLPPTPTSAIFMPDPRSASASTLTSHAPMTSTDSGSQSGRSVSIPSIREPEFDGEIPEEDETDGRSLASTTFSQRSPSHRKYLSSIRRLTGRRSSSYMPGAYPRDSMSMSSEDSSPVATPPDSGNGRAFGIAWPSGSPKRSGSGASRASSFADKIFHRNRTRSNVSTADPGTFHDTRCSRQI